MRLLVTGSRDWPWPDAVGDELDKILDSPHGPTLIVVQGYSGNVDMAAYDWAAYEEALNIQDVKPESHEANWKELGKKAGPLRNKEMVDMGADLCLAFRLNKSRGTTDCMDRCYQAGIPVRLFDLTIKGIGDLHE